MVLPSSANRTQYRRMPSRAGRNSNSKAGSIGILVSSFLVILLGLWACIMFISPRISVAGHDNSNKVHVPAPQSARTRGMNKRVEDRSLAADIPPKKLPQTVSTPIINDGKKPRVVGMYAYQINDEVDDWKQKQSRDHNRSYLPHYMYLTERIDRDLLSHSSQTLRRIRNHDYFVATTPLSDFIHNYKLAIAGSNAYHIKSEDPLRHLMLTSDSRDMKRSITNDSEDYEEMMADPLHDEKCEPTPQKEQWMSHSYSTCNFMHEFDMPTSLWRGTTKIKT